MTKPVVRFAPSPTGNLHVGNVRTALINWLFARGQGGTFILRIDDTDTERSTAAYEQGIRDDLTWLGLTWDKTFKQSERFAEYDAAADKLREMGLLYACYETADELDRQRKLQRARGKPPIYNRAGLELSDDDRAQLEADGRKPHWRFKLSGNRIEWTDLVRGDQSIDTSSLSDPVLIRADGSYLYTLPSCVDDIEAGITHVVRGEDHVTNSGAQIEIFRALGGTAPSMAHTPLLVGADGASLSKRLGSLGMGQLRERGIEPIAICSLLAKLGTSDNVEIRDSLAVLADEFDLAKIGRSPARFDETELDGLNASLVHKTDFAAVKTRLEALDPLAANEAFWLLVRENCTVVEDAAAFVPVAFGDITPIIDAEDRDFVTAAARMLPEGEITSETWGAWTSALKTETGRKGRGLFMPLRKALTGLQSGPDVGQMLQLMGRTRALKRLG
ncbi:MAG: glutamate--tRNA ligase [Alphaproteobacteria bacterium]|nr:glutamate--tRNA ligase [Alphaproteobacteria bacterium]